MHELLKMYLGYSERLEAGEEFNKGDSLVAEYIETTIIAGISSARVQIAQAQAVLNKMAESEQRVKPAVVVPDETTG